jgi:predicted xylose isomerase-like sugar epimerase
MSRALNLAMNNDQVRAAATKQGASISSIEPLFPQGTRVVLKNADQAAVMRMACKRQLIDGPVVRTPLRTQATR